MTLTSAATGCQSIQSRAVSAEGELAMTYLTGFIHREVYSCVAGGEIIIKISPSG